MIYMDNAATSFFKPPEIINAAVSTVKFLSVNAGRGSHFMALKGARLIMSVREKTAAFFGAEVERHFDVGVAGIHRLFAKLDSIREADVVIAVAGMEGALAGVVAGLVKTPVIAVPTSVGYGASFNGLAPLLTMLNSCAEGVAVVNIDNGFGAAVLACRILRGLQKHD